MMEQWSKERLITEITQLQDKLSFYETKLRDLVTAYKSLVKEKEALELSVKVLQNVCQTDKQSAENHTPANDVIDVESPPETEHSKEQEKESSFNADVTTLMNSLATLSVEKSRMEASFQADKKLLRQEKEKHEVLIKEQQEKIKKITFETSKEIEQLKSRVIIEKHEKEKEQNDNVVMMSELQRLLSQEKEDKMNLEKKLSELTSKFQLLVNKEEVERYEEKDITEKFALLQKKHLTVLEEERKRMLQAEQESKEQIAIHERRVANLETRLTELSITVANYHRLRQEDQNEITKLKAQIVELDNQTKTNECQEERDFDVIKNGTEAELTAYVKSLVDKMMKYKSLLLNANEYLNQSIEVNSLLCENCNSYEIHSVNLEVHRKLLNEYESLMQQFKESSKTVDEIENLKTKIQVLQDRNSLLTTHLDETVTKYELQEKSLQDQINSLRLKQTKELDYIHDSYKMQMIALSSQLQKQRDRTLALIEEKEHEVSTLKSSFQMFLPGSNPNLENRNQNKNHSIAHSQLSGVLEGNPEVSTGESPHILHYAHELARRDVEITNLRKNCNVLESKLHDAKKDILLHGERYAEEITYLNDVINRLERSHNRGGANLEYLKFVIVNYFLAENSSSRKPMFKAIASILNLSDEEIAAINKKHNF